MKNRLPQQPTSYYLYEEYLSLNRQVPAQSVTVAMSGKALQPSKKEDKLIWSLLAVRTSFYMSATSLRFCQFVLLAIIIFHKSVIRRLITVTNARSH